MGLINFLYTMGRVAKTRSRAEADTAENVAKVNIVNPLDRVISNFFMLGKRISQVADDPLLPTLKSPPVEDTSVASIEVAPAPHMGPIWDTIQSIAKARSRTKAEAAKDPAKENLLGREAPPPPPPSPLTYKPGWCIFQAFYGCDFRRR